MDIIFPDIAASKNAVPFPAKNGKGKKFFLENRFLSESMARNGTVVTIVIKNISFHSWNPSSTKLCIKNSRCSL